MAGRLGSGFYSNSSTTAFLNRDAINCFHTVDLLIADSGVSLSNLFLTDNFFPVSFQSTTQSSSQDYSPLGSLMGLTAIQESTGIRVNALTITISGVSDSLVHQLLNTDELINKRVVIYRTFIVPGTADFTPVLSGGTQNTYALYDGTIKDFSIEEGPEEAKVSIAVASHWADFDKKTGRFTNQTSQQNTQQYNTTTKFSTDKGFEYASQMIGDIQWGPRS